MGSYPISGTPGTLVATNYSFVVGSGTLTINKAALTITAMPQAMTYGSPVPALTYKVTGYMHGEGSTVITGTPQLATACTSTSPAGTCAITVTAGSLAAENYTFQFVNGVLSIAKAVLKLTPASLQVVYGTSLPPLTYALTGFVNGDTAASATSGKAVLSSSAAPNSPVGQYGVTATQGTLAANNYSFAFGTGKIVVTPATLTVTAQNQSMKAGSTVPPLTFTASGFANGETIASATSGAPTLATTAKPSSKAGSYAITIAAGTMKSTNYQLVFKNGILTITP